MVTSQQNHVQEIPRTFGMVHCEPILTPIEASMNTFAEETTPFFNIKMTEIGGKLTNFKVNINFSNGGMSKFSNKLCESH